MKKGKEEKGSAPEGLGDLWNIMMKNNNKWIAADASIPANQIWVTVCFKQSCS